MEAAAVIAWKPLGEMLIERGLLTVAELDDALEEQEHTGQRLGAILVSRKLVSSPVLTTILAEQFGVELERQDGFGSGLLALIERRNHRIASPADEPRPEKQSPVVIVAAPPSEEPLSDLVAELAAVRAELDYERRRRAELEQELSDLRKRPPARRKSTAKPKPTPRSRAKR